MDRKDVSFVLRVRKYVVDLRLRIAEHKLFPSVAVPWENMVTVRNDRASTPSTPTRKSRRPLLARSFATNSEDRPGMGAPQEPAIRPTSLFVLTTTPDADDQQVAWQ